MKRVGSSESLLLPGYEVILDGDVSSDEILNLHKAVDGEIRDSDPGKKEIDRLIAESISVVGVRAPSKELVGIGFLFEYGGAAHLSALSVHPNHRHQGIGRFLVKHRVEAAREYGLTDIKAMLISTNTLGSYYKEFGVEVLD